MQILPDSYRQCEEAVRKKLEENKRKRKKKQDAEAKQKAARTEEGGSGRGRGGGTGKGGRGRGGGGRGGRGAGPQEEHPETSSRGGESEQGADGAGPSDDGDSDVTLWENELADAVFHEIWLWELRKNVRQSEETEKKAWEARWRGVPKAKFIVKEIERTKTYGYTAQEYPRGVAAWSDVFHMYEKKVRPHGVTFCEGALRIVFFQKRMRSMSSYTSSMEQYGSGQGAICTLKSKTIRLLRSSCSRILESIRSMSFPSCPR